MGIRDLFYHLDSIGLLEYPELERKIMNEWNQRDLRRFIEFISSFLTPGENKKDSIFNFVSNSTLGGSTIPCESIQCRLNNVINTSRFAALYADKLLIPSPLDEYIYDDREIIRNHLLGDILVLIELRPLLEEGLVGFSTRDVCVCKDCLSKHLANKKFDDDLALLNDIIESDYLKNITCKLEIEDKQPIIYIYGPERFGFHGQMSTTFRHYIPEGIKDMVNSGKLGIIPDEIIKQSGILYMLINPVMDDLILQNLWVNIHNSTYLTNREIDIEVINALHSETDFEDSRKMVDSLSHIIPVINNVSLKKILELRKHDGESFQVYRDTLTSIIKRQKELDRYSLKEAYKESILPELNKINSTISRNKKNLTGSIVTDVLFASSVVSIGLFSGLLPANIGQVLAAVGGSKFVYDLYNKIGNAVRKDQSIKDNKFYFLWKLTN